MSELAILTCVCAAVGVLAWIYSKAYMLPQMQHNALRSAASQPGKLNRVDWLAAVKEAAALAIGAALAYLTQWVTQQDFGIYTALVAGAAAWLVSVFEKWRAGPQ